MAHEEIDPDIGRFVAFAEGEKVRDRYYVRKLDPPFKWAVAILVGLPTCFLAALAYWIVWKFFIFRSHGYLLLTDRRILYFERGRSLIRARRYVGSMALEDVAGCRLFVRNSVWKLFGLLKLREKKAVYLNIFTEHFDAIVIGAVRTIRRDQFEPAEDMVAVVHEIGARIHERQAAMAGGVA